MKFEVAKWFSDQHLDLVNMERGCNFNWQLQVAEAEEKTAGGLLLTEATKEKPSIGTVCHYVQQYLDRLLAVIFQKN